MDKLVNNDITYQEIVKLKQSSLRKNSPQLFDNDCEPNRGHDYILTNGRNNLFHGIRDAAITYFLENKISWWQGKPVPHMNSSQIACLNHLFGIRNDKDAVLKIARKASGIDLKDVARLNCDNDPQYIAFEVVSYGDLLNEGKRTRGRNCTSVDAAIIGIDHNDEKWLLPIEWKYTERYGNSCDKTTKGRPEHYRKYILNSSYLKSEPIEVYFREPFYELMRQTIWAEQICMNKETELIGCDHFRHINVIPKENVALIDFRYSISGKNLTETWHDLLKNKESYVMITPEELMEPVKTNSSYSELIDYLTERYW